MENLAILDALLTRRSTRAYEATPVERGALERIVEAACYAPSGMNRQLWHFTVVTNPEKLDALTGAVRTALSDAGRDVADDYCCTYHAPALIIVSLPKSHGFLKEDGACALQTIFLAAHGLGLGSCWINQLSSTSDHPALRKVLTAIGVPADHGICGCAAIGHIATPTPVKPRAEGSFHFVD